MTKGRKMMYLGVLTLGLVVILLFPAVAWGTEYNLARVATWSDKLIETAPNLDFQGPNFRGRFGGNKTLTLTLSGLPNHSSLKIDFNLYIINSWDGNWIGGGLGPDYWKLNIDGTQMISTTFCNGAGNNQQAFPDNYPAAHPSRSGAAANNVLGFPSELPNVGNYGDSIYNLSYTVNHRSRQVVIDFISEGLQQMLDESWGIDNVTITTYSDGNPVLVYSNDFEPTYTGIIAATHVHSQYSTDIGGITPVKDLLDFINNELKNEQAVCNISDHVGEEVDASDMPWIDSAFVTTGNVRPIRGEEWGAKLDTDSNGFRDAETGHATVFNIDNSSEDPIYVQNFANGSGAISGETYNTFLNEASQRSALVWANHPFNTFYPWRPRLEAVYSDIDVNRDGDYYDAGDWLMGIEGRMIGTEVWTEGWGSGNQEAVNWWQDMLSLGKRKVVGIAGSDYHVRIRSILSPSNRVYARSNTPEEMTAAFMAGRVVMVESSNSACAILEADADGDGTFEVFIGDTIDLTASQDINFRVMCFRCKKTYRMRIYSNATSFQEVFCEDGVPWIYTFAHPFSANETNFIRIEIRKGNEMISMTNPIYINIH